MEDFMRLRRVAQLPSELGSYLREILEGVTPRDPGTRSREKSSKVRKR